MSRPRFRLYVVLVLASLCTLAACKTSSSPSSQSLAETETAPHKPLALCAAIRGNGNLIFAHFAALARISEHYGRLDAVAGGSSASITSFLYESMLLNPALPSCDHGACSDSQTGARLSLLLKSLEAYIQHLGDTEEALAIKQLASFYQKVKTTNVEQLLAAGDPSAREALVTLLRSPELRPLVNKELIDTLVQSTTPLYHAQEAYRSITALGSWSSEDPHLFFRPGVIDFQNFTTKIGRIANFYAGYGSFYDATEAAAFLNACALPAQGKSWREIAKLTVQGTSCGERFETLLNDYRTQLLAAESSADASLPLRINDPIGMKLPALIATSVLDDTELVTEFETQRRRYLAGESVSFTPSFEHIRFGYWGDPTHLAKIVSNPLGFTDLKTKKLLPLGQSPWREALSLSPAEPGLARILAFDDHSANRGRASAGGWSDLHPTLVLKNLGCEDVIYITRQGGESSFATGVARRLGMTPTEETSLYALETNSPEKPSSFAKSLRHASVWCTDWDSYKTMQLAEIFMDAYNAPFGASSSRLRDSVTPYPHIEPELRVTGCTPQRFAN